MRFFNFLILSLSVVFGATETAHSLKQFQSFEAVHKHVVFARKDAKIRKKGDSIGSQQDFKIEDPAKAIIFIDLDDTLLSLDGRTEGTQTLLDPLAIMYINKWRQAGFQLAFLTSRKEDERATTLHNLTAVGIKAEWNIPLFITDQNKKGEWLLKHHPDYLKNVDTIIHIDDKSHQLESVGEKVCKGKTCHLIHFGAQGDLVYGDDRIPDSIDGFSKKETITGGTQSTFVLSDPTTGEKKFVLKKGDRRIPQFKEEVMADAIYQAIGRADPSFGIQVPTFKLLIQNGSYNRVTEFLPGAELGIKDVGDVAKGFVVDAFMANWDLVVGGKNLWLSGGNIYRMDNGGSLRYRAMGDLKSTISGYDFADATCDMDTMRGMSCGGLTASQDGGQFYGGLTEADILKQIEKLIPLKDTILKTADDYNDRLQIDNYAELRSNLITRLDSLRAYYYNHPQILARYERAHPLRMIVPEKSSASILVYSEVDGTPKVLLGKRVRHDWWGNFGGKADHDDHTLLNAAVRETQEESMGLFHFLKEGENGLSSQPSHDLIKGGDKPDALHRMYLAKHDFVAADQFTLALNRQTDEHSKEYTDFEWVDVSALLALVEANLQTENDQKNEAQYTIKDTNIHIHHPLMDMLRQQPVLEWLRAITKNAPVRKIHTQGSVGAALPTIENRNVGGYDSVGKETTRSITPPRYPAPPFWDPRSERLAKLTHVTTKHMDVLTELKKRPKKQSIDKIKRRDRHAHQAGYSTENANRLLVLNPNLPDTTATDAYLAFALGGGYKPGHDQENVFTFLKDHSNLSHSYASEFSSDSSTCGAQASYKCALLDAMEKEREMKDWFVFYHTLPGKMSFIYDIASEFRNVLRLQGSDSMNSLRVLDKFFKGLSNVDAYIKDDMVRQKKTDFRAFSNYDGNSQEVSLSTNIYLFGSPAVETSSSFHMFHENETIQPPNYQRLLSSLLSEFGITDTQKYFDLFNRYFGKTTSSKEGDTITETGENHLLQIFIHPDAVDKMVYLAGSLGAGLYGTAEKQKQELLPSTFFKQMREHPQAADKKLSTSALIDKKNGGLHGLQARIFMKPELMTDSSKVRTEKYTKSTISDQYMAALKVMVRDDLKTWLDARYALQSDTLENPKQEGIAQALPPLQKVVRHLDQTEGKTYTTKTPEELYGKFLMDDNVEGIKQILARNPDFDLFKTIKNPDYNSHKLTINPLSLLLEKENILNYLTGSNKSWLASLIEVITTMKNSERKLWDSQEDILLNVLQWGKTYWENLGALNIYEKAFDSYKKNLEKHEAVEISDSSILGILTLREAGIDMPTHDVFFLLGAGLNEERGRPIKTLIDKGVKIDIHAIAELLRAGLTEKQADVIIFFEELTKVRIDVKDIPGLLRAGLTVERVRALHILQEAEINIDLLMADLFLKAGITEEAASAIATLQRSGANRIEDLSIPDLLKAGLTKEKANVIMRFLEILKAGEVDISKLEIPDLLKAGLTEENARAIVILKQENFEIYDTDIPQFLNADLTEDKARAIVILKGKGVNISIYEIPDLLKAGLTQEKSNLIVTLLPLLTEKRHFVSVSDISALLAAGVNADNVHALKTLIEGRVKIDVYKISDLLKAGLTEEKAHAVIILKNKGLHISVYKISDLLKAGLTEEKAHAVITLKEAGVTIDDEDILALLKAGLTADRANTLLTMLNKQEVEANITSIIETLSKLGSVSSDDAS